MSSSSSSFTSFANTPQRNRARAKGAAEIGDTFSDPPMSQWVQHFVSSYFACELCQKVAMDPVQVLPKVMMVCRQCAIAREVPSDSMLELPHGLQLAFEHLYEAYRHGKRATQRGNESPETNGPRGAATHEAIAGRRIVRAKRGNHALPVHAANSNQNPNPNPNPNSPAGAATASGEAAARSTPTAEPKSANNRVVKSPAAGSPLQTRQHPIREAEESEIALREKLDGLEAAERVELVKRFSAAVRNIQGRTRGSSKMLKAEADVKYEEAEYTMALELYTKAIEQQPMDRLTRLSVLYGNRSSAFFMAQRYNDCISDCMRVIELDSKNARMHTRAAKAAAIMGDLSRAVSIIESVPESLVTDSILDEKKKYKQGCDVLQRAERSFGSKECEEAWLMLIAQFSDTIPFRLRYAESLMKQKRFKKAVEALEIVSPSRRTPKVWYMMANCHYLSGFEYLDKARACLTEAQQLDDNCAKLLCTINIVEDGKQKGNTLFQQKKFAAAVEHYTTALAAAESNKHILRILYCNRAAAHKELGKYREGIDDCTKAIQIDSQFSKAYARRARCHQQLNDFNAAVRDFKSAMQYDPTDHELGRELRNCEHNMAKETEREKDFYYVLGVTRTSNEREIKLKYRELSLRWHPDKCMALSEEERQHAERKFKIIGEAHATLIDPTRRREYDLKLDRERLTRPGGCATTYSGDAFRGQAGRFRAGNNGFW